MKTISLRRWTQFLCTVLSNSYAGTIYTKTVSNNMLKGVCVPFLNCYSCPTALFACPIGTLQHYMSIHMIPYYLLGFLSVIGMTIGRMACGWACPFGYIQDLMFKISQKHYSMPYYLKYVKYFVLLILVIVLPYITGEMWFSKICPAGTLTAGIPWTIWNPVNQANGHHLLSDPPGFMFYLSLIILISFCVWFTVAKRPFCRVFCPMGAFFALFNNFSMIRLKIDGTCDNCSVCQHHCPVDLNVSVDVGSGECIRCLECTRCEHVYLISEIKSFQAIYSEPEKS
jgi:polyferredoxin